MKTASGITWLLVHAMVAGVLAAPSAQAAGSGGQGWDAPTSTRFHYEPQGTVLMPAAFLRALRTTDGKRFMDPAHLRSLGFIDGDAGRQWPLGLATNAGGDAATATIGFACAACHTGQLEYRGKRVRIEGGSASLDLHRLSLELRAAVVGLGNDAAARKAFVADAVRFGYPTARADADLAAMIAAFRHHVELNAPVVAATIPGGPGRVDALTGIAFNAFTAGLATPANAKKAIAPVSLPPLWDIWHFDWVQYNASVRQPMDRNIGEAIGVGAMLNIIDVNGVLNPEPQRWKTSIPVKNLHWIEGTLAKLQPPAWPGAIFGAIDRPRAAEGRKLFASNCAGCHGVRRIAGSDEWNMKVVPLERIGTDRMQAVGFAAETYDARKLGLGESLGGPEGLAYVVERIKQQAYRDAGIAESDWPDYDGFGRTNPAEAIAPCGYKARPLVGIWATPPFLHNGAVPSVYDLLSEQRPARPILGNREFDPKHLGMQQVAGADTLTLDTNLRGNSNRGHWFTNDESRPGRIGRAFTDAERFALIEYLKSTTYADYPAKTVAASEVAPLPCAADRGWAAKEPPQ